MKQKLFFLIIFILGAGIIITHKAFAQTNLSLTVFPAIQDITITPGERTRGQIQFRNASDSIINGQVKVADFVVKDQTGTPVLIEANQSQSKYSAASWFSLNQEFIAIPPKDFVTVDFTINPPQDISTCSRHSIIYFEQSTQNPNPQNPQRPESVSQLAAQLGGIVNLIVDKEKCQENLEINNIKTPKFLEYGPISLSFNILNLSDFYITPQGTVTLFNFLNQVVDQKKISEQRIFPEAVKEYTDNLGERLMIGRYKILIKAATNGKNSVSKEAVIYAWVFPWKIAIAITLALIIIIIFVRHFYTKTIEKEHELEKELAEEKKEIEELKKQLKQREE